MCVLLQARGQISGARRILVQMDEPVTTRYGDREPDREIVVCVTQSEKERGTEKLVGQAQ